MTGVQTCALPILSVPGTIIIHQEQTDTPITIVNNSDFEENYSTYFSAPFDAVITSASGVLPAGKSTIATLSIAPNRELANSTYDVVLEVQLGEKKAFKNVRIVFKEEEVEVEEPLPKTSSAGFVSLGSFNAAIASVFTLENAINTVLAIVAAFLLIAFIARFVKRLEVEK